jgi:hypothetical protein
MYERKPSLGDTIKSGEEVAGLPRELTSGREATTPDRDAGPRRRTETPDRDAAGAAVGAASRMPRQVEGYPISTGPH